MASYKIKIDVREIEKKNYHLFIDLKMGGKPCRLLLDTGASKTVLDAGRILTICDKQTRSNCMKANQWGLA
jgi:predicted aspartyl protease